MSAEVQLSVTSEPQKQKCDEWDTEDCLFLNSNVGPTQEKKRWTDNQNPARREEELIRCEMNQS